MKATIEYTPEETADIGVINEILAGGNLPPMVQFEKTTSGGRLIIEGTNFQLREALSNIRPPRYSELGIATKKTRLNNSLCPGTTILEIGHHDGVGGIMFTPAKDVDLKQTEYNRARHTGIYRMVSIGDNPSVRLQEFRTDTAIRFFVIDTD